MSGPSTKLVHMTGSYFLVAEMPTVTIIIHTLEGSYRVYFGSTTGLTGLITYRLFVTFSALVSQMRLLDNLKYSEVSIIVPTFEFNQVLFKQFNKATLTENFYTILPSNRYCYPELIQKTIYTRDFFC